MELRPFEDVYPTLKKEMFHSYVSLPECTAIHAIPYAFLLAMHVYHLHPAFKLSAFQGEITPSEGSQFLSDSADFPHNLDETRYFH